MKFDVSRGLDEILILRSIRRILLTYSSTSLLLAAGLTVKSLLYLFLKSLDSLARKPASDFGNGEDSKPAKDTFQNQ
jgi:hypothetical protein